MADTFQLTDGTTTVDLIYNSSSNPNYRLRDRDAQVGTLEPRAIWHRPDDFPAELIDTVDDIQQASFTVTVHKSSGIDDMLDAIVKARRLLRRAQRYSSVGDVARVVLKIKLNGATNATLWPVIYGWVDDSRAQYESVARIHSMAYDAQLHLYLAPYGEAETPITLRNQLAGSTNMVLFNSGLAYGLTLIGSPTPTQNNNQWLSGGSSQRIVTDASSAQGIQNSLTASQGSNGRAFLWITAIGNNDPVVVELTDGSDNLIQSKTYNNANPTGYDATAVDGSGRTWYRYSVTGMNNTAADFRLKARRPSAGATQISTFSVDMMYLGQGGIVPAAGWSGAWALRNRADVSASEPGFVNYIDVWGIPGDAPALVNIELDWSAITGSKRLVYVGRGTDGQILASRRTHWIESDQLTAVVATNAAWTTSTGTSDNHYHRLTQNGTGSAGSGALTTTISGDSARRLLSRPARVFGLCRSSDTATKFGINMYVPDPGGSANAGTRKFASTGKTVPSADTWTVIDFGLLNVQGLLPYNPPDTNEPDVFVSFGVTGLPASGSDTADLDALLFLPTEEFLVAAFTEDFSTSNSVHIRGQYRDVILSTSGVDEPGRMGSAWFLEPGPIMNRLIFLVAGLSANEHTLTDAATVTLTVTPRTRHLLGTL